MDISTIVLGAVQGFAEFLPISSSGHLAIVSALFDRELPLAFSILLHIATLFAVLVYTFPLIVSMCIALYRETYRTIYKVFSHSTEDTQSAFIQKYNRFEAQDKDYLKIIACLCVSTIATIPMGLFLKDKIEFLSIRFVGVMLLCTAVFLLIPFLIPSKRRLILESVKHPQAYVLPKISYLQAMLIGLIQGFAIFPGISRSGATITFAVLLGVSFIDATRYSFLMSIPAILASFVLSISDLPALMDSISYKDLALSMLITFVTGLIGLIGLSVMVKKGKMWVFSIYLLIISSAVLVYM